jgi:hypothetical protein
MSVEDLLLATDDAMFPILVGIPRQVVDAVDLWWFNVAVA